MISLVADQMKVLESASEISLLRFTFVSVFNFLKLYDLKLISLMLLLTCLSSIGYERDEAVLFSFFS